MSQSAPSPLPTQRRSIQLLTILGLVLTVQLFLLVSTLIRGPGHLYLAAAVTLLALAGVFAARAGAHHLLRRGLAAREAQPGATPDQTGSSGHTPLWLRSLNLTLLSLAIVLQTIWFGYTFRPCSWLDPARRIDGCVASFRHVDTVTTFDISPDGQYLVSRSLAGNVSLWSLAERQRIRRQPEGIVVGPTVAFSPDGSTLAVGKLDGTVQLSDTRSGAPIRTIGSASEPINGVRFSPDGTLLATGAWDQTVRIWQIRDGALLHSFTGLRDSVHSVIFSPDGTLLAASDNRAIWVWNVRSGAVHARLETDSLTQSIAFSPDGTLLAAGGWRGGVGLWRVRDGSAARRLALAGHVSGIAFSSDGTLLAAAAQSQVAAGQITIWRVADAAAVQTIDPRAAVGAIAWLPGDTQIAVATGRQVELWQTR